MFGERLRRCAGANVQYKVFSLGRRGHDGDGLFALLSPPPVEETGSGGELPLNKPQKKNQGERPPPA